MSQPSATQTQTAPEEKDYESDDDEAKCHVSDARVTMVLRDFADMDKRVTWLLQDMNGVMEQAYADMKIATWQWWRRRIEHAVMAGYIGRRETKQSFDDMRYADGTLISKEEMESFLTPSGIVVIKTVAHGAVEVCLRAELCYLT